MSIAYSLPS
ncbi:hypothetical protein VCHENC02_3872A, partial [Vibrio harveyi]